MVVQVPGFEEVHTPGAPGITASPNVQSVVGSAPDLNTVTYVRTAILHPRKSPRVIMILIPGFLGGAATFAPLAEQLVREYGRELEVWVVDRRPNQLEDRRGALHAAEGSPQEMLEGVQFYFPDLDRAPQGNFPGGEDFDIDGDGNLDPPFELPDALGASRSFVKLAQDDVRFMAHWGVDTYARDWKILVDRARSIVGEDGLVLFGGHSLGTGWAGIFAAYDFDPGPGNGNVDAAFEKIDGLVLLEGGGPGAGSNPPTPSEYAATIADLEAPGGGDVYLANAFGLLPVVDLGAAGELAGVLGTFDPDSASVLQNTSFGATLSLIIQAPATNRSVVGFFLDDEFTPNVSFRTSLGFSDDGTNFYVPSLDAYIPQGQGTPRLWKEFDDPTLPTCPPAVQAVSPGCAILDNGPRPGPTDPPQVWGLEREVSDLDDLLRLLFTNGNLSEWYFVGPRASLDFRFGRDSTSLGDESLLAVTQNANVDVPVVCIGGSNGLTPTETSFANYLGSIATPAAAQRIEIIEGYAHFDILMASDNEAVPVLVDWIDGLLAP
jgi:pimeloyl-ACP methyl ester carboxylesterase